MMGIMLSLTESKMTLLALALLFLYVALLVFEVGSSITLVTSSSKSLSSRMLSILHFQVLKLEAPSSLSSSLTEEEAMLSFLSDYKDDMLLIYKTNPKEWIYAGSSLQFLSSFHALSSDTMLELGKIQKQKCFKIFMFTRSA
jgi:hypothetical protein